MLAVTTDNASNNKTMMSSIQESLQSLELNNSSTIVRVPCISHVIQLSLNDLLGKIKAIPKNENIDKLVRGSCPFSSRKATKTRDYRYTKQGIYS